MTNWELAVMFLTTWGVSFIIIRAVQVHLRFMRRKTDQVAAPTPEQIEEEAKWEKRRELAAQLDEWDLALYQETGKGPHAERIERQQRENEEWRKVQEKALKWHQEAQRIYIPAYGMQEPTTMAMGQPIPFPYHEVRYTATSCSIRAEEAASRAMSSAARFGDIMQLKPPEKAS